MRICGRFERLCLILFCVFLSIIYLISKPNNQFFEFNESQTSFVSNENSITSTQIDSRVVPPKWTVLSDGTVIHLGNFVEESFKNINFIKNEENICEELTTKSLKLLILIESKANNFERREAIRETWAQPSAQRTLNFKIVFLLGLHNTNDFTSKVQIRIEEESQKYRDIIQINTIESYQNLTIKTIASLKWFLKFCRNGEFYFKTDDDIPIHALNLIKTLSEHKSSDFSDNSIVCHKNPNLKIIRNFEKISEIMGSYRRMDSINRLDTIRQLKKKLLKYKINYSQLPGMYFPHYCSGFGYGFSRTVADLLYQKALTIPYFMIEDVFITGFCRQKANLDIKDTKHLTLRPAVNPSEGICAFKEGRINANEMSIEEIRSLWTNFSSKKRCDQN